MLTGALKVNLTLLQIRPLHNSQWVCCRWSLWIEPAFGAANGTGLEKNPYVRLRLFRDPRFGREY